MTRSVSGTPAAALDARRGQRSTPKDDGAAALHRNRPWPAVGQRAGDGEIASGGHQRRVDAAGTERRQRSVDRHPLGDAAEIDRHATGEGDGAVPADADVAPTAGAGVGSTTSGSASKLLA